MTERTITEARFNEIAKFSYGARIETRDGVEYAVFPSYDIQSDKASETLVRLIRGEGPKIKPGDTLTHTQTGSKFDIIDPLSRLFGKKRDGKG